MEDTEVLVNGIRTLAIVTAFGPVVVHLAFWRNRQLRDQSPTRWRLIRLCAGLGSASGLAMTLLNYDYWTWVGVTLFLTSVVADQRVLGLERRKEQQTPVELRPAEPC